MLHTMPLICRIGSLEMLRRGAKYAPHPYLPHRQLRKPTAIISVVIRTYLPHRQLRKDAIMRVSAPVTYLPHRQLRKEMALTALISFSLSAA